LTIDYHKLKRWDFPAVEQTYTDKDTIFYSLSVGYCEDPVDHRELPFVYEKDLRATPTMAAVLAYPGLWIRNPETGIDWLNVVHGEQSIRFHRPLPSTGTVVGRMLIKSITDKGAGRGALFLQERELFDKHSGELLATLEQLNFCRGDGGYSDNGGTDGNQLSDPSPFPLPPLPAREPERVHVISTSPRMALFYRLCADRHPIHVDPIAARAAGFSKPILHGLATYAIAGHALLAAWCDYRPSRLKFLRARFSAPLFPGETVRTEMWKTKDSVQFRCLAVERDTIVINNGVAEIASGDSD